MLYGQLRKYLGEVMRKLAIQREQCYRGHLVPDHIHMLISIPPKYSVSQVIGYIKGNSAILIALAYMGRRKNFTGQQFWVRGYYVSTAGLDEDMVLTSIKK